MDRLIVPSTLLMQERIDLTQDKVRTFEKLIFSFANNQHAFLKIFLATQYMPLSINHWNVLEIFLMMGDFPLSIFYCT
jgi:hypothetical protein